MKRAAWLGGLVAAALMAQEHAPAAHGAGHDEPGIVWKWANFAMLAGALGWMIAKNAPSFFAARDAAIQKGLRDAARIQREAQELVTEVEEKTARLGAEIEAMRQAARNELAQESARATAELAQDLAKAQRRARQEIDAALHAARQELHQETSRLALELAEHKLRARLNPEADSALMQSFLIALRGETGPDLRA